MNFFDVFVIKGFTVYMLTIVLAKINYTNKT